jgi:tetratricopeptide (TPR) repeat protein
MTEPGDGPSFLSELKRRRVVRVAIGYAAAAFVVLQAAQVVLEPLGVDPRAMRWLVIATIVGFPVALLLGWAFDVTSEGLRLTRSPESGPGRVLIRTRPLMAISVGAVLSAVLIGLLMSTSATADRPVEEGTEMIAVLPFSVSGEGIGGLQDGMVELLSRNLDEVGGVRTADPRMVMRRWRSRGRGAELSLEDAIALARETYATSFLSGSVVGTGRSVRITANLYSMDGVRLATARVDGPAQGVLSLVDSLSVALLRDVWRTSQPIPQLDVAAVTSSNLGALRHFLDGERHYRVSNWNGALRAYREAVQEDTLFALAYYKLSVAAGWLNDQPLAISAIETALRHVQRLPEREQTLVRTQWLRRTGRTALSVDTLSLYIERYPDDAEAWFFLADDLYHLRDERAEPLAAEPSEALYMFDRALELDSTFVPSLIHPLEVAFAAGDTARAAHYVRMLAAAPLVDSAAVGVYRLGLRALQQPGRPELAAEALVRAAKAPAGATVSLMHQAQRAIADPLISRLALQPASAQQRVVERLRASGEDRGTAWAIRLMAAGGRIAEASREMEQAARERGLTRATLKELSAAPVLAGVADTTFFFDAPDLAPSPVVRAAADALLAFDRKDPAAFRSGMTRLHAATTDTAFKRAAPLLLRALERALRGDGDGLVDAEGVLQEIGYTPQGLAEGFWFRTLAAEVGVPGLRDRALRRLSRPWRGEPVYEPLRAAVVRRAGTTAARP